MKKNILCSILFLFLSISAYAESSGSALIAPFHICLTSSGTTTQFLELEISNISYVETSVVVSLITGCDSNNDVIYLIDSAGDKDSGLFIGLGHFESYNESPSTGSIEMTIKPFTTVVIYALPRTISEYRGYGKIDWFNNSDNPIALIANLTFTNGGGRRLALINGGDPF